MIIIHADAVRLSLYPEVRWGKCGPQTVHTALCRTCRLAGLAEVASPPPQPSNIT